MNGSLVLVNQVGALRILTLNRPAALNSLTADLHTELIAALDTAASDAHTRSLILTGAGRAFCAGQDLSDPWVAPDLSGQTPPKDLGRVIDRFYKPLVQRLRSLPIPVVAAVNGVAAGAGANLALHCDLVLAARSATFIQAFGRIGLVPDTGGTWLLPRLLGRSRALGLALLGDKLSATDAERMGLIWQCTEDDALVSEAQSLALRLADMPTKALVSTRRAFDAAQDLTLTEALDAEARTQSELGHAADYREGVSAFAEKRTPRFSDR